MLRKLLLSALALSASAVCVADTEPEIRYRRDQCDMVCAHKIKLREDRQPCYAQCSDQMKKELKTATKENSPQYVERPGDCPITPKKDVEEILGIKIQKVVADNKRWMTCDFVSEAVIVRITNSVGTAMISARDPHTGSSKPFADGLASKLEEAARKQIKIWENHREKKPNIIKI